jgi:hypothetical protein
MNLHEYSFETTGFTVLRNLIPVEKIEEIKSLLNNNWPTGLPWKFPFLHLGRVFWEPLSQPWVQGLAKSFAGEHFRLDHAFGVTSNGAIPQLHGGPQSSQLSCFYIPFNNGKNLGLVSQINFGVCVQGQSPTTGGFCYIPGSHKSTDPRDGHKLLAELYLKQFNHHSIIVPTLNPGDIIMFTEGLVHGDTGWKDKKTCRIQLYYRINPGFICWRDPEQNKHLEQYAVTDYEKRLLRSPWTGRYTETSTQMGINNERRTPTI